MWLAAGGPAPYGRYPPPLSAACINPPSKAALPIRPNWPTALIALEGGQARHVPAPLQAQADQDEPGEDAGHDEGDHGPHDARHLDEPTLLKGPLLNRLGASVDHLGRLQELGLLAKGGASDPDRIGS
jgi:hypothetical protein